MIQKTLAALNKIYATCKYAGWDGYGALPVEKKTLVTAREFIKSCPRGFPQPEIGAEPDGQITLEWRKLPEGIISISVGHDRKLSLSGNFGNRGVLGTTKFKTKFPRWLANYFKELFPELVNNILGQVREFRPSAYYDPNGDCIEFIATPEPFYGQRLDSLVTVYLGQDTGQIVGSLIKGVKKLIAKTPHLKFLISDGKIKLEQFLTAHGAITQETKAEEEVLSYKNLVELSEMIEERIDVSSEPALV